MTFPSILQSRVADALGKTSKAADLPDDYPVDVVPTQDPKFGDYQCNAAMVLAKRLKTNPREFAAEVIEHLEVDDLVDPPEIAGPGFLNFRLKSDIIANRLLEVVQDERLGVPLVENPETIVVDFSAPNIAKQMHVGHIRSTIIGDCLARVSRFLGHNVITDNHIGDWGTQFGMVIYGWKKMLDEKALQQDPITELLRLYKIINRQIEFAKDPEVVANLKAKAKHLDGEKLENIQTEISVWEDFLASSNHALLNAATEEWSLIDLCREELVKLQQGDAENLDIWRKCVDLSLKGLAEIYRQLNVSFDHYLGESHYNDDLKPLVDGLIEKGIARESDGAICVFSDESKKPEQDPFKIQRDGEWHDIPCMVQKSDGGFNYATTDLTTVDYRLKEWNADQIWYVVGVTQTLHFRQIIEVTRMRGQSPNLVHVAFGSILGKDRKMFKTRSGESIGLQEVLTESVERAAAFLEAREAEDDKFTLPADEKPEVARVIGIGSVKFAELSQTRMTDYVFDWNKFLALKGSTAPYLLYSYVRTRGIFRKLDQEFEQPTEAEITEPAERTLAMALLRFGEVVPDVLNDHKPNVLAAYLYDLAKAYHSFFQACHVLSAEGTTKETRLLLCEATSRVLKKGLELLGIETTERM